MNIEYRTYKTCENCGCVHSGTYGSGRFCSSECAHAFSTKNKRKEINKKVSKALKGRNDHLWHKDRVVEIECEICGTKIIVPLSHSSQKTCHNKKCHNEILSRSLIGKTGGYRKGSGISKGGYYKNQYFDSSFEIEVAKFLTKNNITWKRNTTRFYFIWNNKKTYYIPDFIINNNIYLETKGYWYKDKKEKTLEAVKKK